MGNYHDQIAADRRPNLCFDGIDTLPIEGFNPQVLLNPFEEQLDLPAALVIVGDLGRIAIGDVGQQDNILIVFRIDQANPSQGFRVTMLALLSRQPDDLVTLQPARRIDRRRGFPVESQVLFGPDHKAAATGVQVIQALVIQIGAIHDVDAAGQDRDYIQDVYIVGLAVGDMDKCGDSALQVQYCVNFNGGLAGAELRPRKQRQTKVDGRGVQRFDRFGQLVFAIKLLGTSDQHHGQVLIDVPGTVGIGIGERAQGHLGFDAHMVAARPERIEGGSQIPQAVTKGELTEAHAQQLIPAREFLHAVISFVMVNDFSKFVFGNNIHKL